ALNPRNAVAPQPLPAGGEGRQSVALAGWGSWDTEKLLVLAENFMRKIVSYAEPKCHLIRAN
ncbi:hypothetical protein, partial [[Scytonema hofmanni] UTEX B 1581]